MPVRCFAELFTSLEGFCDKGIQDLSEKTYGQLDAFCQNGSGLWKSCPSLDKISQGHKHLYITTGAQACLFLAEFESLK
jgi:hypothetical protein